MNVYRKGLINIKVLYIIKKYKLYQKISNNIINI